MRNTLRDISGTGISTMCNTVITLGPGPPILHFLHKVDNLACSLPATFRNDRMGERVDTLRVMTLTNRELPRVTLSLSDRCY